jgi:MFS family permease
VAALQQRTVWVLAAAQVLGGIGTGAVAAVGALLAADLASESLSGLSSAGSVVGSALIAMPVARVMQERGRRPGLQLAYLAGIIGTLIVILGATLEFFPLALLGVIMTGGGMAAGLQLRYTATDLATPQHRGRALSDGRLGHHGRLGAGAEPCRPNGGVCRRDWGAGTGRSLHPDRRGVPGRRRADHLPVAS